MAEEYRIGAFSDISDSDNEESGESTSSSESDVEQTSEEAWSGGLFTPIEQFIPNPVTVNPELGINENSTPLECFQALITPGMIRNLSNETNLYVQQVQGIKPNAFSKWKEVTDAELWNFVALNLAMGITRKPTVKDYWTTNEILMSPFFSKVMSRNRFEQILTALHFSDNETAQNQKRFHKLGFFFPALVQNFRRSVFPREYLCLDETLMGFKGRLSFKQYNPKKRRRFGIKFFVLVDCYTKVVLDMLPYEGKTTEVNANLICELGFGGAAVMKLLESHLENRHKVVIDNYFNSPRLAQRLLDFETYILGTVRKNRKNMPVMKGKLKKGEVNVFINGKLIVERWQDRREVVMLNTFVPHTMEISQSTNPVNTRLKPGSVLLYNETMGAVDEMDKAISIYANNRKTYKWYKKVFFFLLDVAVYNAFRIIAAVQDTPISHKDFILQLVSEIVKNYPIIRSSRGRPCKSQLPARSVIHHFPVKVGKTPLGKPSKSDCVECRRKGRRRTQTQFKCKICNVRLCLQEGAETCFESYHQKRERTRKRPSAAPRDTPASSSLFENSEVLLDLSQHFHNPHENGENHAHSFLQDPQNINGLVNEDLDIQSDNSSETQYYDGLI